MRKTWCTFAYRQRSRRICAQTGAFCIDFGRPSEDQTRRSNQGQPPDSEVVITGLTPSKPQDAEEKYHRGARYHDNYINLHSQTQKHFGTVVPFAKAVAGGRSLTLQVALVQHFPRSPSMHGKTLH